MKAIFGKERYFSPVPNFFGKLCVSFRILEKSKLLQTLPTAFPFCARKFGLEEVAIFKCYTKLFKPVSKSYMPPTTVQPWSMVKKTYSLLF